MISSGILVSKNLVVTCAHSLKKVFDYELFEIKDKNKITFRLNEM
jgi:V8-like Glu-specific endopeptidase